MQSGIYSGVQYLKKIIFNLDYVTFDPTIYNPPIVPYFYYQISNNGNNKNFFGADNIIGYTTVKEIQNGKGYTEYNFSKVAESDYSYINTDLPDSYNTWKNGLLLGKKIFDNNNVIIHELKNKYNFDTRKNTEFGYNMSGLNPEVAFFGANLDIRKNIITNQTSSLQFYIYNIQPEIFFGYSADIQNYETEEINYFNNSQLKSKVKNIYTENLSSNPFINIIRSEKIDFESKIEQVNYKYAHEKGNQYLVGRNMVGIPLETINVLKSDSLDVGKQISKSEIIYPVSQSEADTKTTGLSLPYEFRNTDNLGTLTTEVTYDRYDSKGNVEQYTSKDGIPTAIIWGYDKTQPIAKVVGAAYNDVSGLVSSIVTGSNTDASNASTEDQFIAALDTFRKDSSFINYQITTYTYDPLIGVTSITPPSGIREVYIYDTANRLKEIREESKTGKLLKEFKYNYKQ